MDTTPIYLFNTVLDEKICGVYCATTEDNKGIDTINHPLAAEYDWVDAYAVDRVWAERMQKGRLADRLLTMSADQLFLSPQAYAALEGLRLTGSVRILPATIVDAHRNKLADVVLGLADTPRLFVRVLGAVSAAPAVCTCCGGGPGVRGRRRASPFRRP
jgi:hypothetical protein